MKKSLILVKLCLGVLCSGLAVGCYKHSYTVGTGGNTEKEAAYSKWHAHWLVGLIGEDDVNVNAVCPSGNATIKDSRSFVNLVVWALVGTIYSPTTVEVYCGDGSTAAATLTPEQLRAAALKPETMDMAREISAAKAAELQSALDAFQRANSNVASNGSPARL